LAKLYRSKSVESRNQKSSKDGVDSLIHVLCTRGHLIDTKQNILGKDQPMGNGWRTVVGLVRQEYKKGTEKLPLGSASPFSFLMCSELSGNSCTHPSHG
jgi:hypothetical protein